MKYGNCPSKMWTVIVMNYISPPTSVTQNLNYPSITPNYEMLICHIWFFAY